MDHHIVAWHEKHISLTITVQSEQLWSASSWLKAVLTDRNTIRCLSMSSSRVRPSPESTGLRWNLNLTPYSNPESSPQSLVYNPRSTRRWTIKCFLRIRLVFSQRLTVVRVAGRPAELHQLHHFLYLMKNCSPSRLTGSRTLVLWSNVLQTHVNLFAVLSKKTFCTMKDSKELCYSFLFLLI